MRQVVAVGPGTKRLTVGDRVVIYHIAGCSTRTRGRCAFVGEGGQVAFAVPDLLIHKHHVTLDQADEAYRVADEGLGGKVCIVFE